MKIESKAMTSLEALTPLHARVGFGSLGTAGSLGYESKGVSVNGTPYSSALGTDFSARTLSGEEALSHGTGVVT